MAPRMKDKTAEPAKDKTPGKKKVRGAAKKARPAAARQAAAPAAKKVKRPKPKKGGKMDSPSAASETAQVLSSAVVYQGSVFRVTHDKIVEPAGVHAERDIVRHNGSAVILAVDRSGSKKNPWVVMERQYRHAAGRFLWEIPAGRVEPGEDPLAGARRELAEEAGYQAKKWKLLAEYWPSPGFVGESMRLYLAEGLYPGHAEPDEDERIELRLVKLSEILGMIEKGAIHDGKTLIAVLLYSWLLGRKRKK